MPIGVPPPEPFQAHERFEDFVVIEVRYPLPHPRRRWVLPLIEMYWGQALPLQVPSQFLLSLQGLE